jgi:hypothetical protein
MDSENDLIVLEIHLGSKVKAALAVGCGRCVTSGARGGHLHERPIGGGWQ